ncbi:MAG TPA: hypothetical protein VGL97_04960 [Bryobacteraceae bacterium]|jgi:hypothetical protein
MTFIPWRAAAACRTGVSAVFLTFALSGTLRPAPASSSSDLGGQVSRFESAGDLDGARALLVRQAETPGDNSAAQELAEFLCRHGDAGCREAYAKWSETESDPVRKRLALRELVLLDYMNGKQADLAVDLKRYRDAGGNDFSAPSHSEAASYSTVTIPGPISSFARMAALSPDLAPEDLLPALARNVVTNGYEAAGNESLQPTEYLRLVTRYVGQARELQAMANKDHKIVIPTCDSEETGALLKIIGYRMRGSCGADIVLETVNPTRAFLTVDSGFPLTQLEQDLRANHRFELSYAPTSVPVLYTADYWLTALNRSTQSDFIDAFLSDPSLCRLYLGLSHLDRATAEALRKQAPPAKLKIYSHVLDFYGGMFQIRNGAAVVPGPARVWAGLVGVSPNNPGAFFTKLMAADDGWMASYFDALSRLNGATAVYLTQPERLKRFYDALRGKITSPGPARPVFRASTELMLLTNSLRIDANGQPHVPGNLEVWRTLFIKHPHGKYDGKLTRAAANWRTSDDLLEALFGLSRKSVENEPLKIFLALNDIDRWRAKPISPELASRLVSDYRYYGAQYALFADSPHLSEAAISQYLDLSTGTMRIRDMLLRSDEIGTLQALVELWRVLCRQGSIAPADRNASFVKLIDPFGKVKDEAELFDAGRAGVNLLLSTAEPKAEGTKQDRMVELLVGKLRGGVPISPAEYFLRVFDAQRLVSLDGLFIAADKIEKGTADAKALKNVTDQLKRLQETDPLHGSLSAEEKNSLAVGYWSERHVDQERKLNVDSLLKGAGKKDPKTALAPLLRDSLVGMLYSYYAPPGAQLLFANPLLVRSHDFIGPEGTPVEWRQTEVGGSGWPESAGGRLTGSLISLPYAIAEAEQNFLTPKREQALIWADLVPQMIVGITVNRWRDVTADQIRWVSLHLDRGRALMASAALDPAVEPRVLESLRRYLAPARVEWIDDTLHASDFHEVVAEVPSSVLYAIASDPALKDAAPDVSSVELAALASRNDPALSPEAIARTFGTPKPTLTHSYRPGLLYLRTFPALMGYSSRILAESWESNNLYYAALADEAGVPVSQLDAYVPEWNRAAIENIFATHLEDWPALLRSLDALGASVRQHGAQSAALNETGN